MILPPQINVFERGWLSSNNVLICSGTQTVLVDSGYSSHAQQTLALLQNVLGSKPLDTLINTHLHSDHCGGNQLLQYAYPKLQTFIPPGQAESVESWDAAALSYVATGQTCSPFCYSGTLQADNHIQVGDLRWEIHSAPGHDPNSVILFEASSRILISADALWENGFGVVFPELDGMDAFGEVADTLDLIQSLEPKIVIPGHGRVFSQVEESLKLARSRLKSFVAEPIQHARYAAKVLLKFRLLELQRIRIEDLVVWALSTPYFATLHTTYFGAIQINAWIKELILELVKIKAAKLENDVLLNL